MRKINLLALLFVGLTLSLPGFAAKDPMKDAIKARKGEMQLRAFNAGPLFAMAKGDIEYDAERAQLLANNLAKLLEVDIGASWMPGSDNEAYPDDTTSLKKIWTTYPEIIEYGKKYAGAVQELAKVAGNGSDALKANVGALGKSCKGCHDDFRTKK